MITSSAGSRLFASLLVMLLSLWLAPMVVARWGIGIDTQRNPSNPFRVYLHCKQDRAVQRGDYATFRIPDFAPRFPEASLFVKQVAAIEGDRLQIVGRELYVNDRWLARINPVILARAGLHQSRLGDLDRVPPGRLLMMGSSGNSFDSRYFGLIKQDDLQGKAVPLW